MWKHVAASALTVITILLAALAIGVAWVQNQYKDPGPLEVAICLRVESGSNMVRVSKDLLEAGAISYGAIFRAGADYQNKSHLLKAGAFLIEPGASMEGIVAQVTTSGRSTCGSEINFRIGIARTEVDVRELDPATGRFEELASFDPAEGAAPAEYAEALAEGDTRLRVTLAEGVTSWQVVEGLKLAGFLDGDPGPVPAEGSLAPQSYEVREGADRAALIADMATRQAAILADAWDGRADGLAISTPEEALILASIIEKETSVPEERRTISQVFMNRLEQGIRLQFDPTIIYGITRGQGILDRPIRQSDIDGRTEERQHGRIEYNTYQIDGLPAGPIANPGRASIEAAVNPDGSDFVYFVADGSGGHAFAVTLDEHNANVRKWREIEAQSGGN